MQGGMAPALEMMTPEEVSQYSRARDAIQEYRLVSSGAATYAALGYCGADDKTPMVKLLEYLAIDADIKDALEEVRRNGKYK